jgi:predicted alpha/beta-fold hydrolase
MAGLSGGNDNGYLYSMMKKATENGFKCVVVNFRGTSGVKMTSSKFYGATQWKDFKEPLDYIHSKYCDNEKEGFNKRKIYGYGASLGGAILNLYLVHEGEKAKLSGAIVYGFMFNPKINIAFFKEACYGFYNYIMGSVFAGIISEKMPEMQPYMDSDRYEYLSSLLKKHKGNLMDLDYHVLSRLCGFEDLDDYYESENSIGKLHKITVPTMYLNSYDDQCISN